MKSATARMVEELGPWFHNLHLPDGSQTAPDHPLGDYPAYKWEVLGPALPADLRGWTALDIGCNAGFYAFELARRGAEVTAIDVDGRYLAQAAWAAEQYGLADRISWARMQVYDLARTTQSYDLVLFMGVFYHLRYPLLGLDIVAQRVRRLLAFQTMSLPGEEVSEVPADGAILDRRPMLDPGWPRLAFIENSWAGDPTNWWVPNRAAVEALLRSSGLKVIERPGDEMYVCEPDELHPSAVATWNAGELLAATGQQPSGGQVEGNAGHDHAPERAQRPTEPGGDVGVEQPVPGPVRHQFR
jgi:tRNA (mo5U34)-methyltransferase